MRGFVKGRAYYVEAIDHDGHLGRPGPGMDAPLPFVGWYAGTQVVAGVPLVVLVHAGSPKDPDSWSYSRVVEAAISRRVELPEVPRKVYG